MLDNKINKILYNIDYILSNLDDNNNINSLLYNIVLDFKIAYDYYKKYKYYRNYNYVCFFKSITAIKKINKLIDENYILLKHKNINQNKLKQNYNKIVSYLYKIKERGAQVCQK